MTMRVYTHQHRFYCGIDRHARSMHLCILDPAGQVVLDKDMAARPEAFLKAIAPFRPDLVVGAECMYAWYWLADLCTQEKVPFALGHALYMKRIYGAKAKNDKIDAGKIARLLQGGQLPARLRLSQGQARNPRPAPPTHLPGTPALGPIHAPANPQRPV